MSNLDTIRSLGQKREADAPATRPREQLTAHGASDTQSSSSSGRGEPMGWDDTATIQGRSSQGSTRDRDELMSMCAEVNLLELVREDTGELGKQSGNCVAFHLCPVCGNHDDFRVYPDTNSWACFSASNPNADASKDASGGNVLDYLEQARHLSRTDAVKWLRDRTGHPFEPARAADRADEPAQGSAEGRLMLPPWESVQSVNPPKRSPQLIHGLLRRTHLGVFGGKGKIGKSWLAIELCTAVATGGYWLGFKCERGRCLYIDPEIDPKSLDNRFSEVGEAMGADRATVDANVVRWSLRGIPGANTTAIAHDLKVRGESFDLIFVDSCSCLIEGKENESENWTKFFIWAHEIAGITGASVMIVHHFGKGNDGDKDASDRFRGSSTINDRPDVALTLTEILPSEGEPGDYLTDRARAFEVEAAGQREFGMFEPIHIVFDFPTHYVDASGITADWRPRTSAGRSNGGRQSGRLKAAQAEAERARVAADILALFYTEGVGTEGLLVTECSKRLELDSRKIVAAAEESDHLDIYRKSERKTYVVPAHRPQEGAQEAEQGTEQEQLTAM